MPTTNTATRSTGKPRKPRETALPKTIRTARISDVLSDGHFWAASMLNDDGELQAIERLTRKTFTEVTLRALIGAQAHIRDERNASARHCQRDGGLLYAFHGSKAFAQAAA